jgi:hypothetical protein
LALLDLQVFSELTGEAFEFLQREGKSGKSESGKIKEQNIALTTRNGPSTIPAAAVEDATGRRNRPAAG